MRTLKLYHYSNTDLKKVKPTFFGYNSYTFNDVKVSKVKRAFYYLAGSGLEHSLGNCRHKYTTDIKRSRLYDLRQDKASYISRYNNDIDGLLKHIRKGYDGAIYNIGNLDIAILFKTLKVKREVQ